MKSKEEKIKEFFSVAKINGSGYESVIIKIIDRIYDKDFSLALDYNINESRIDWKEEKIWIRIKSQKTSMQYIWDLLHEFGHLISGERPTDYTELDELQREEEAWNNAFKEIEKHYPNLLNDIDNFNNYKEFCLETYRRKHDDLKNKYNTN